MNGRIEDYLSRLTEKLVVPEERAALLTAELRAHFFAAVANRIRAGLEEDRASQDAVADMGDVGEIAEQFNQHYRREIGGALMLRAIAAAQVIVLGVTGILVGGMNGMLNCLRVLAEWRPGDWSVSWANTLSGLHADRGLSLSLELLALLATGVMAGYLAGRRGWAFGLIVLVVPWVWVEASDQPVIALLRAATVIAGAHLGTRLHTLIWRRGPLAVAAALGGVAAAIGYVDAGLYSGLGRTGLVLGIIVAGAVPVALLANLLSHRVPTIRVSLQLERSTS